MERRTPRDRWIGRIGTYLIGVAIGCLLLGLYWQGKAASVRKQKLEQEQREAAFEARQQGSTSD